MPRDIDETQLQQLREQGLSQREIARRLNIPRSTLQDHLTRQQVVQVHSGTPTVIPRGGRGTPEVDLHPQTPAELGTITADLLEVAAWWRARKMRRLDPGEPRDTQRQTWHVDKRWIEQVKEMADSEGVSQAEIVDRAFRQFFETFPTS
jgi:transcriptional regulator with XRE-family HTH domain